MAIYHCFISNVSRSAGSSSCASLAYISGDKIHDDRTDISYNFNRKERILITGTLLPQNAPDKFKNPSILFNEIENFEKADNARTAKKIQLALPKELNLDEQKKIVEDFILHNLTPEGYCATFAIHDGGNSQNFHAHILVANRPLNSNGKWQSKQKMQYALDSSGNRIPKLDKFGNQKTDSHGRKQWKRICLDRNLLDSKDFLLQLRKNWAIEVNKHLSPDNHIDYRSNSERGLIEKPTIHEGYAARAIEKNGGFSDRCQINRDIRSDNSQLKIIHQQLKFSQAKSNLLQHFQSVNLPNFNMAGLISSALNFISNIGQGGVVSLNAKNHTDWAEKLKQATSPDEIARILAIIEEIAEEADALQHIGGGVFFDQLLAELERENKERDILERIRRRKRAINFSTHLCQPTNSVITNSTSRIEISSPSCSTSYPDYSQSASRDYVAELCSFRREESEREIARTSQEPNQSKTSERNSSISNPATSTAIRPKKSNRTKSHSSDEGFSR